MVLKFGIPLRLSHLFLIFIKIYLVRGITWGHLGNNVWDDSKKVSSSSNSFLITPFIMEEIHTTIFSMGADKALGPDGFSMFFYQTY
jgi:hypothetical protein